jgi:cytidylate kinase
VGYVVTIDGPAGVGKSTAARGLARRLDWFYLNSGSLYRAVAWNASRTGLDPRAAAQDLAARITFERGPDGDTILVVGSERPGQALRTEEIGESASLLARDQEVRGILHPVQRSATRFGDLVAEGRDMGTVVFPEALVKFFLDADVQVRARRRSLELENRGVKVDRTEIRTEIAERDARDRTRDVSPLRPAPGAVLVDTSKLSIEDVIAKLAAEVTARLTKTERG